MTLSISKEERNGEYKAYLKEETTSCLLDKSQLKTAFFFLSLLHSCSVLLMPVTILKTMITIVFELPTTGMLSADSDGQCDRANSGYKHEESAADRKSPGINYSETVLFVKKR